MRLAVLLLLAGGAVALLLSLLSKSGGEFTKADVERIAGKCGVAPSRMILHRGWITVIAPAEDDTAGICMMRALKQSGKRSIQVVANQLHTSDGQN